MKRLALFLALSTPAFAGADLCEQAPSAICESPPARPAVSLDSIRAETAALADKSLGKGQTRRLLTEDDFSDPSLEDKYLLYLNALYDTLLGHLKEDLGITELAIERHVDGVRGILGDRLRAGLGPAPDPTGKRYYNEQALANAVSDAALITPRSFREGSAAALRHPDKDLYFSQCGDEGLARKMYGAKGLLMICPGMLLDVLEAGSLDALTFVAARELARGVDPVSLPNTRWGKTHRPPLWKRYAGFTACVQKNKAGGWRSFAQTREKIDEEILRPSEKSLGEAPPIADPQFRFDVKNRIAAFKKLEKRMGSAEASLRKIVGHAPSITESHLGEFADDQFAAQVLGAALLPLGPAERVKAVKAAFRGLCRDDAGEVGELKEKALHGDDGQHLGVAARIEESLRNPVLRLTLGCPAAKESWCAPSGRVASAVSCEGNADSPAACEAIQKKRRPANCPLLYLSCANAGPKSFVCEQESSCP